jgi:hypothetical protein
MRILIVRGVGGDGAGVDDASIDVVVRHLDRRGPRTADRDDFHRALGLLVLGRLDEALGRARASAAEVPWLYEALQLEGDILIARSAVRERGGDVDGAEADLLGAGEAYARAIGIARSDAWLYEAEAERVLRLVELRAVDGVLASMLCDRAIEAGAAAGTARPHRALPLVLAARAHLLKAEILKRHGGDPEFELAEARRLVHDGLAIEPENTFNADLQARTDALLLESRGADSG